MDGFKATATGGIGGCISLLCSCACLGGMITFVVYLGKYAFDNPNKAAWYGVKDDVEALYPTLEAAQAAGIADEEIVDIHNRFVTWFLWGFLMMFGPCYVLVIAGLTFWNAKVMGCCTGLAGTALGCSGLAWWIAGMVWRLNAAGTFASGDLNPSNGALTDEEWITSISGNETMVQYSSGNFMFIYLLITWISLGVSCGCSIIGALVACMCK